MLSKPFIKISKRYQPAVARDYVKKLRFIGFQASGLCDERLKSEHFINQRDIRCFPNRRTLNFGWK